METKKGTITLINHPCDGLVTVINRDTDVETIYVVGDPAVR